MAEGTTEQDETILSAVLMRFIERNPHLSDDEIRAEGERIYAEMQRSVLGPRKAEKGGESIPHKENDDE